MTDNEFIEALEYCCSEDTGCLYCPLYSDLSCMTTLKKFALDLIKRKQTQMEQVKGEAVKEFAERLKMNITINNTSDGYLDCAVDYNCLIEDIDDIVEEMVGDTE